MLKYDLNLREYWRIIKRRKIIIIFTVIIMGVFSFISAIMGKPVPIYKAAATVKVEKTQSVMGINPQFLTGTNMETQTFMIRSYYVLELTAKKMGLIPENLSSDDLRNNPKYIGVIMDLKDKVKAEQEGTSDLININVTANDPKSAAYFANSLAEVYRNQHNLDLNRRTFEGKKFVESQFVAAREKMVKSEEAIKKFREDNKWATVESESTYTLGEIKRLQSQYNQEQIVFQKLLIAERALDNAKSEPLMSKTSFYFEEATPPYKALNDKLVGYMVDRDTLLLTYTDNFPQIRAIRSQVKDTIAGMKTQLRLQKSNLINNQEILKRQIARLEGDFKKLPEKGLELAKLEREVGINREVYTLLEKKYQEILIAEAEKLEEVKIVKPALEPTAPTNPANISNKTSIGTLMGLILGLVFAFLIETFDTSIGAIEEVEEFLGVHVLGIIPFVSPEEMRILLSDDKGNLTVEEHKLARYTRMATHYIPSSTLSESYKAFRTSVNFVCTENHYKSLVLTSSSPGEGKTSTIVNLALTMAQAGYKVLLIDGDLRRPVVASVFGIEQTPGLTDIVLGNYEWRNVVRNISDFMMGQMTVEEVVMTSGMDNLNIITSGTHTSNPAEIIGSKSIGEFMKQVRAEYDMVLVDAPPVLAATDATLWSNQVDATIIVYQVGKIARGALKRAKMQLDSIRANIVGVVLNGIRAEFSTDFTYHDYYYYHYRYGDRKDKNEQPWYKDIFAKLIPENILNYKPPHKNRHRSLTKKESKEETVRSSTSTISTMAASSTATDEEANREQAPASSTKCMPGKKSTDILKIVIVLFALLFLALGMLYQGGYLKLFFPAKVAKPVMPSSQQLAPQQSLQTPLSPPVTAAYTANLPAAAGSTLAKPPAPGQNMPYTIQVKAVQNETDARPIMESLRAAGMDGYYEGTEIKDKGRWVRIFVGGFSSREAAQQYIKDKNLDQLYSGAFIFAR